MVFVRHVVGVVLLKALGVRPRRPRAVVPLGEAARCRMSPAAAAAELSAVVGELPAQRARPLRDLPGC